MTDTTPTRGIPVICALCRAEIEVLDLTPGIACEQIFGVCDDCRAAHPPADANADRCAVCACSGGRHYMGCPDKETA